MIGREPKQARKLLGLSQSALADKLQISRVMVGLMERGEKTIEHRTELSVWCLLYETKIAVPGDRARDATRILQGHHPQTHADFA